jgi:hypothetical protein
VALGSRGGRCTTGVGVLAGHDEVIDVDQAHFAIPRSGPHDAAACAFSLPDARRFLLRFKSLGLNVLVGFVAGGVVVADAIVVIIDFLLSLGRRVLLFGLLAHLNVLSLSEGGQAVGFPRTASPENKKTT